MTSRARRSIWNPLKRNGDFCCSHEQKNTIFVPRHDISNGLAEFELNEHSPKGIKGIPSSYLKIQR